MISLENNLKKLKWLKNDDRAHKFVFKIFRNNSSKKISDFGKVSVPDDRAHKFVFKIFLDNSSKKISDFGKLACQLYFGIYFIEPHNGAFFDFFGFYKKIWVLKIFNFDITPVPSSLYIYRFNRSGSNIRINRFDSQEKNTYPWK